MGKRFDKQQLEAIETLGTNVLVSASAGAGKTGVLVERLTKRTVRDKVSISRIVAMTFTQAAAEEMKKRLAGRLNEEYATAKTEQERLFLAGQLAGLSSADITTIDSYCLKIIRKYYSTIGLDPKTIETILDEGTSSLYRRQAFDLVLAHLIETEPQDARLLLDFFSPRPENTDILYDAVCAINRTAQAGMNPEAWYEDAVSMYAPVRSFQDLHPSLRSAFLASITCQLENMQVQIERMKELSVQEEKVKPETLEEEGNMITNCLNHLRDGRYESYRSSLTSLAMHRTSPCTANGPYSSLRKKVEETKKALLETAYPQEILISDHNDMSHLVSVLVNIARAAWDTFCTIKKENTCMDFTDMERFAYEILQKNNGSVASILQDSLDEILVDEFQDTSELQNAIITCISNGHNVFRVGDVKQSIYRFRQAKPELMRSLMHDPDTHQITLRHNYRSKDSIVTFTNLLFSKIMNIDGCQDTYTELDAVSIGENNAAQMEESLRPVIFACIEKQQDPDFDPKRAKADWISAEILSLMKKDPSLHFSDFAILVRSHADKNPIRQSFEQYNIPYDIDGRDGFFQSSVALTILSMVHVMLDSDDELHLLAVAASPLFGYNDEQLAQLKIRYGSIMQGIKEENGQLLQTLQRLRCIADHQDIPAMLSETARINDYYNRLSSRDQANFDFLFEKAVNGKYDSLMTFLEVMEAGQDEKSSEAMARGKDDDAVIATTIHQSKGLQYKIVFLWGTSANRFNDAGSAVMVNDTLKLGISHLSLPYRARRSTIARMAVEYQNSLEDVQEFVRLLYVAVTRAEHSLYLVDCLKEPFEPMDLNVSFLLARKGITGTMDIPLQNEPLYQTIMVDDINPDKAIPLPARYAQQLPVFHTPVEHLPSLSSPSSLEVTSLPPLEPSDNRKAKSYGTRIHEIIEELPDTEWNESMLKQYRLHSGEVRRILSFGSSDLYHKALTMHIEKEFPFFIISETERTTGSMDFVAWNDHEVMIIDFKTDHCSQDEIYSRYHAQLNAYRSAAQTIWPDHQIRVYVWSIHHEKEIEIFP